VTGHSHATVDYGQEMRPRFTLDRMFGGHQKETAWTNFFFFGGGGISLPARNRRKYSSVAQCAAYSLH